MRQSFINWFSQLLSQKKSLILTFRYLMIAHYCMSYSELVLQISKFFVLLSILCNNIPVSSPLLFKKNQFFDIFIRNNKNLAQMYCYIWNLPFLWYNWDHPWVLMDCVLLLVFYVVFSYCSFCRFLWIFFVLICLRFETLNTPSIAFFSYVKDGVNVICKRDRFLLITFCQVIDRTR